MDGALQFLDAMLEENGAAVSLLRDRLTPIMQGEHGLMASPTSTEVDPRSDLVRKITGCGERLRDHTNLVKDALERLDV